MTKPGIPLAFLNKAKDYKGNECLLWPYAKNSAGYGHLSIEGRNVLAHRLVCEAANGPPTERKKLALHSCSNGHLGCVTPSHLRWGDDKDNKSDSIANGTLQRGNDRWNAKLTAQDVLFIRKSEHSSTYLANLYGVCRTNIVAVRKRKSWAWI